MANEAGEEETGGGDNLPAGGVRDVHSATSQRPLAARSGCFRVPDGQASVWYSDNQGRRNSRA